MSAPVPGGRPIEHAAADSAATDQVRHHARARGHLALAREHFAHARIFLVGGSAWIALELFLKGLSALLSAHEAREESRRARVQTSATEPAPPRTFDERLRERTRARFAKGGDDVPAAVGSATDENAGDERERVAPETRAGRDLFKREATAALLDLARARGIEVEP